MPKFFFNFEQLVYSCTYVYVCEYGIKVVSYTEFQLNCPIADSSQVKQAVISNTTQS